MPFKRGQRRKGGFKRKVRKTPGLSYSAIGSKIWRDVKMLKGLINVERKFFDDTYALTAQTYTGVINLVSQVQEGTDYNNRVGLSIKATHLLLRGCMTFNTADSTDDTQFLRIMVIKDLDNNPSDAPAVTDVLESSGSALVIDSPLNHTNGKRFQVLRDKRYTMSVQGPSGHAFKMYIPINDHIKYSNSTTGLRENQLYILTCSGQSANGPAIQWYSRLRFIDN